jgi:urease accessory protein
MGIRRRTSTIIPATTTMTTTTATPTTTDGTALPLLVWLSPAFPVGSFAYSHGLEWAIEAGAVKDAATLSAWLATLLDLGGPRNDAILLAASWRAAQAGDAQELAALNDLALALAPSRERLLETGAQGSAFVTAIRASWPCPTLDLLPIEDGPLAYPVAVGVAAAGHGIALAPTLDAFVLSVCAALVSAAIRLSCVGQTEGQRVTASCLPKAREVAAMAAASTIDDLGGFVPLADIGSMRHETQYSRLFRS